MISKLTDQTIVINIDAGTAIALLIGAGALILYSRQVYSLIRDLYPLVKNIHFTLIQAPLEAAMNASRTALDKAIEGLGE
jgi:hypothetical protein